MVNGKLAGAKKQKKEKKIHIFEMRNRRARVLTLKPIIFHLV